jgi:hypothetical protein
MPLQLLLVESKQNARLHAIQALLLIVSHTPNPPPTNMHKSHIKPKVTNLGTVCKRPTVVGIDVAFVALLGALFAKNTH